MALVFAAVIENIAVEHLLMIIAQQHPSSYNSHFSDSPKYCFLYETAHDKTYNKTCVTSKDSDQPVHSPSKAIILSHSSFDSLEVAEGTCNQRDSDQPVHMHRLI